MDFKTTAKEKLKQIRKEIKDTKPKKTIAKKVSEPKKTIAKRVPKPKICGIYKITCNANGKIYIGSSKDIKKRWGSHLRNLRVKAYNVIDEMQNDFDLYGENNFSFEVLHECIEEELLICEIRISKEYKVYKPEIGYNKRIGMFPISYYQ